MTNALEEALKADLAEAKAIQCLTCQTIAVLDGAQQATLLQALGNLSHATISRALKSLGYDVPADSIRRHLKKEHSV